MIRLRSAVGFALAVHAAENVVLGRPLDVVADQQIQQAVAIEIEPERRGAEGAAAAQAGLFGDVDEVAAPGVLKQAVLADGGDQNIGEAVVVVVGDGHAHAVHFDRQAGWRVTSREGAVAVVAVELQGAALALVAGPIHAVDQQNVQPAVAVVIQKGAAGAHGFGQILRAESAAVVAEVDAGGGGDVGQAEARSRTPGRGDRGKAPTRKVRRVTRCSPVRRGWRRPPAPRCCGCPAPA